MKDTMDTAHELLRDLDHCRSGASRSHCEKGAISRLKTGCLPTLHGSQYGFVGSFDVSDRTVEADGGRG